MSKRELGQYYTTVNPFVGGAFALWDKQRPGGVKLLEPFAGAGNLFNFVEGDWVGYDIEPHHPDVIQRDVLKDFPTGFSVAITNPPYLAKNSAKRRKLPIVPERADLYLDCLAVMLNNCEWVAAIIPSTFWSNNKLFANRCIAWDKLDYELFDDTDNPVGVAYFGPDEYETQLFVNGKKISTWVPHKRLVEYNVPHGNYVLNGIDKIDGNNIFIKPVDDQIDEQWRKKYLKDTSRHHCLFYCPKDIDCDEFNKFLSKWRTEPSDFYLTSFMSTMKCGKYRKRIGFTTLTQLIEEFVYGSA